MTLLAICASAAGAVSVSKSGARISISSLSQVSVLFLGALFFILFTRPRSRLLSAQLSRGTAIIRSNARRAPAITSSSSLIS